MNQVDVTSLGDPAIQRATDELLGERPEPQATRQQAAGRRGPRCRHRRGSRDGSCPRSTDSPLQKARQRVSEQSHVDATLACQQQRSRAAHDPGTENCDVHVALSEVGRVEIRLDVIRLTAEDEQDRSGGCERLTRPDTGFDHETAFGAVECHGRVGITVVQMDVHDA